MEARGAMDVPLMRVDRLSNFVRLTTVAKGMRPTLNLAFTC